MTTLDMLANSSSASRTDFVSTDAADLASHMHHCASSRGRFFAVQSALELAHGVMFSRIVTMTALFGLCLALVAVA